MIAGGWQSQEGEPRAVLGNLISNTWRNPVNAQFKRQMLYGNVFGRMDSLMRPIHVKFVPMDAWSENGHDALKKRIDRAIDRRGDELSGWFAIDNLLSRGYWVYFTDIVGLPGFEEVSHLEEVFLDALKGITPPGPDVKGRFRPYRGSQNWATHADISDEEDKDKWKRVAGSGRPLDQVALEKVCLELGIKVREVPAYWRSQWGPGFELEIGEGEGRELMAFVGLTIFKGHQDTG